MTDDELKKLRDSDEIISQQEAMRIIVFSIDEALSRGAQRPMVCDDCRKEAGICVCTGCWEKAKTKARDADSDAFILALTELSRERDEARAALTMADKNFGVIYEGQRAALAKAEQERDAARAVTAEVQGAFGLAKSNARAVAFEEAARLVDRRSHILGHAIRALSSSPPSGQWVAADVMEKVKAALDLALRRMANAYDALPIRDASEIFTAPLEHCRAALSALESEAK